MTGDIDPSGLTEREHLVVRLADQIIRDPHAIDDEFFDQLREEFSDEEIIDLCFAVWMFSGGNAFNSALDLEPIECRVDLGS